MASLALRKSVYAFLLGLSIFSMSSCKTSANMVNPGDLDEEAAALSSTTAAQSISQINFNDLKIEGKAALLGTIRRKESAEGFATHDFIEAVAQEMWQAFAGKSQALYFLGCEARAIMPAVREADKCSQPLKVDNPRFTFSFQAVKKTGSNTFESCTMLNEGCQIYQTVTVDDQDNAFQRGAVFTAKEPVGPWVYLLTRGIFTPPENNVGDFLRRWIQSPHVVPLVVPTDNIPAPYGKSLAGMFGACGKQWMNLLNIARYTKENIMQKRKPVTIVNSAAIGIVGGFFLAASIQSATSLVTHYETFRISTPFFGAGKFVNMERIVAGKFSLMELSNASFIPGMIVEYSNLEKITKTLPENSPLRKTLEIGVGIGNASMWLGTALMGGSLVKNLSKHKETTMKTAKVLTYLAVGAGLKEHDLNTQGSSAIKPAADAIKKEAEHIQRVYKTLAAGDITATKATLCKIQMESGIVKTCPKDVPMPSICNK